MKNNQLTKKTSLFAPCAFACLVVLVAAYLTTTPESVLPKVGYVFFVEPFYSARAFGSQAIITFVVWLSIAMVIVKARKQRRNFRPAVLILLPAVAVCAFNSLFETGTATPAVAPTAVVALIGALLYETAYSFDWSRITMAALSFITCFAYGMGTVLGLWGALLAAATMVLVQLTWSSVEMNVLHLTFALRGRQCEYR